jgi:acetylornithine deacetylase/succinyl-diaminopimelate desuccinylase-like protein
VTKPENLEPDFAGLDARVDADFHEHLQRAKEFLRIPSVFSRTADLVAAADYVSTLLRKIGATVDWAGRPDAPIVYARLDQGMEKTLLVYGMYDVQPAEQDGWTTPPFEPTVRDVPGLGDCLFARGACNSKGPLIAFINALGTVMRSCGSLPINLVFTIEGEEEEGSASLDAFYRENRRDLKADAAFEPFWAEYGTDVDRPTVALGTKGSVSFELVCHGGDWGGPTERPVHSSVAAWIGSPTWRLLRATSQLVDEWGNIAIPALQAPLACSDEDEGLLRKLAQTLDESKLLALSTARRFKYPLHGVDLLRKYYFSPTIHLLEFPATDGEVVPPVASAKLFIRLTPGLAPPAAVDLVKAYLADRGFDDIRVVDLGGYPGVRTPLQDPVNSALLRAYRARGCDPQIIPLFASSTPYYVFTEILNLPYASGGLGKAGGSHGVDEYCTVEGLRLFEQSIITFLFLFASST